MLIVDILVMYTKPRDIIEEGEDRPGGQATGCGGHLLGLQQAIAWGCGKL